MVSLHAPTLFMLLTSVTIMTGLLLLASWLQSRELRPLMWWGIANLLGGVTTLLIMLRGVIPDFLSINFSNALLALAFGVMWAGFRLFCKKRVIWPLVGGPSVVLLLLFGWTPFYESMTWRITAASVAPMLFALASAWELRSLVGERLVSRYLMTGWLIVHACFFGVRPLIAFFVQAPPFHGVEVTPWFSAIAFEALLNVVALAFLQIAMIRERAENQQRDAARTDLLTGALNRRALFSDAPRILARCAALQQPVSALIIDIDHFKAINDRFGHDGGDAVLTGCANTMRTHLRGEDFFARLGGEEFACILPNTSLAAAAMVAEGLRARVANLRFSSNDAEMRVSISIGVAVSLGGTIDTLLRDADRNLFEAKAGGRNRISAAPAQAGPSARLRRVV